MALVLKNPHSVLAVLNSRPADVLRVTLSGKLAQGDAWERVAQIARTKKIPVSQSVSGAPSGFGQRGSGKSSRGEPRGEIQEGARMGQAEAQVLERKSMSPEELFKDATKRAQGRGIWLALDGLQDPHNVGAIFRTAAFFGVQGILLTQDRSAPLTGTVYDVATGGMEQVPFASLASIQHGFHIAKDAGLWILGTSEHVSDDYRQIQKDRPWLLVLGNEEKGMRRLTEEACDVLCGIAPLGAVTSLNVSVAAGVLISNLTSP